MCKSPNGNSRCLRVALKITKATLQLRVVYRRRPPQLIQTVTVGGACETALPFLVISCPLFRGTGFVRGMRGSPLPYPYRFKARGSVGDVVRSPYGVRTGNVLLAPIVSMLGVWLGKSYVPRTGFVRGMYLYPLPLTARLGNA